MDNKYLKLAREARKEGNSEDAKKYYEMVKIDDPDNGEAKFFYAYYALYEGKNMEIASRFVNLCKVLESSVSKVVSSSESSEEKYNIISDIVDSFVPETWNLNRYMNKLTVGSGSDQERVLSNSDIVTVSRSGMDACFQLGDIIEKYFSGDNKMMALSCKAWKEGIALQQKWYAYGVKGRPEQYAAKIVKYDPSYVMPKKAGCISFADKR